MSEEMGIDVTSLSSMSAEDKALLLKALLAQTDKTTAQAAVKEVFSTPRIPPKFASLMSDLEVQTRIALEDIGDDMSESAYAFVIIFDGHHSRCYKSVVNLARKRVYLDADDGEWSSLAQFVWAKGGSIDSIYVSRKASQFNRDAKTGKPVALRPKVTKTK